MINLIEAIYSIRMDREGEVRLTLDIPSQYLKEAMALTEMKERALAIRFAPVEMDDES